MIVFSLRKDLSWNWLLRNLNAKSFSLKFHNTIFLFLLSPSPFPFPEKRGGVENRQNHSFCSSWSPPPSSYQKNNSYFLFFLLSFFLLPEWARGLKERKNRYCFLFSLLPTSFTHHLFSPFFFLSIFRFWNRERKRKFISSYFHFSFLLGNRSRQLRIHLPSLLFFFSRREWKWK